MAELRGTGPCLEALLAARGRFPFEQDREPFTVLELSRLRLRLEFVIRVRHAGEAELAQHVDGGVGQHCQLSP
ncbi:hypothetical protein D9M69_518930 [compost metagenome]